VTIDDLLKQGIAALNEGRRAEARRFLAQVVQQDEHNEMAWLWLSGAVDTDAERRVCLENVLKINPNNNMAKRGLERLGVSQSVSPFTTIVPLMSGTGKDAPSDGQGEYDVPDEAGRRPDEPAQAPSPQRPTERGPDWIIALGAGLFVFVCIVIIGGWWAVNRGLISLEPRPTAVATADIGQTPTTIDTASTLSGTRPPTWTPRPTQPPPTPAPTRTPRPTNTPRLTWTPTLTPTATLTGTLAPTPTPALTLPPTWTPLPTSTPAPGVTLPPTWTPLPTSTPAPGVTLPPTWTPHPTSTPAPGLTLPPTWTPYPTNTPVVTPTTPLTGTLGTATPTG